METLQRARYNNVSYSMYLARYMGMGQLNSKLADLNWKVEDAKKDVGNLKCGFSTLKDDLAVLESARSELLATTTDVGTALNQHADESASDLSDLLNTVEEKEKVVKVKKFTHPCGGSGWEQVKYLDFRESGTLCPSAFAQTLYPERPYTCGDKSLAPQPCDLLMISVGGREYSKMCGRTSMALLLVSFHMTLMVPPSVKHTSVEPVSLMGNNWQSTYPYMDFCSRAYTIPINCNSWFLREALPLWFRSRFARLCWGGLFL